MQDRIMQDKIMQDRIMQDKIMTPAIPFFCLQAFLSPVQGSRFEVRVSGIGFPSDFGFRPSASTRHLPFAICHLPSAICLGAVAQLGKRTAVLDPVEAPECMSGYRQTEFVFCRRLRKPESGPFGAGDGRSGSAASC
jgi:hypothetical protein